ncbi:MAG: hypothetical protein IBX69_07795 [Anaerolineales bacterium]|nr:hypothetical protein [Anaerolineales bacterium]
MENKEFSPLEFFYFSISRWWIIFLFVLIGGGVGFLFHQIRPPIYETKAVFSIHIDFGQTGVLSEFEQDYAINSARFLMFSTSVVDQVERDAEALNIPLEALELGRQVFFERKQSIVEIKVRNSDAEIAAQVANLWASHAFETLRNAHGHALQAEMLKSYIKALETCEDFENETQTLTRCEDLDAEELKAEINSVTQKYENELIKSRGIIPALVFDLLQTAPVPSAPIAHQRNYLMLAGALIGFSVGIIYFSLRVHKL